jgi:hypothetical protein
MEISENFLDSLEYQWSADIELCNGIVISIWWTAWPPRRGKIKRVLSVSTDLPRFKIAKL